MIVDKYTKTAWTILAISLFVISEVGFKNTANLYSVSDSAKLGGQIGWISENQISEIIKKNDLWLKTSRFVNLKI